LRERSTRCGDARIDRLWEKYDRDKAARDEAFKKAEYQVSAQWQQDLYEHLKEIEMRMERLHQEEMARRYPDKGKGKGKGKGADKRPRTGRSGW
jgi:hypothetical protein